MTTKTKLFYDQTYTRGSGIFHPDKAKPVSIIGCGSLGSSVAETLARMGFTKFHLFDADFVDYPNLGCQNFGWEDIGKPKVEAVRDLLIANSPVVAEDITIHNEYVKDDTRLPFIPTIVGVDSMEARKTIWNKLKGNVPLIVDGRIGGQVIRLFGVPNDYAANEYYEKTLYTDAEAVELPCTQRNVAYVMNFLQFAIGRMVRNFYEKGTVEKEIGFDAESFVQYVIN